MLSHSPDRLLPLTRPLKQRPKGPVIRVADTDASGAITDLDNAIFAAAALLALHNDHRQDMLNDALVEMRMSSTFLMVTVAGPPESGQV